MNARAAPRVLFVVQHLLGVGHLVRASRIAQSLHASGMAVTVASGGLPVPGFPGEGIELVQLPPLRAGRDFSDLLDAQGRPADTAYRNRRRDELLTTLARVAPQVLIVEAFPFGRSMLRHEFLPLLEAARPTVPLILCSVRDILQQSSKPGRAEETVATIERCFDRVLVHGDPTFASLEASFPLAARIADRLAYTGLVTGGPPAPATEVFDIIVSAGGGAVGRQLLETALAAKPLSRLADAKWCVIAGPNLDPAERDRIMAATGVAAYTFRDDLPALLGAAQVSISQAGYNTVGDILRSGCHSVLVPYTEGGETEQADRARRLAARGRARVIEADRLTAEGLATELDALAVSPRPDDETSLALEGAATAAVLIDGLLREIT